MYLKLYNYLKVPGSRGGLFIIILGTWPSYLLSPRVVGFVGGGIYARGPYSQQLMAHHDPDSNQESPICKFNITITYHSLTSSPSPFFPFTSLLCQLTIRNQNIKLNKGCIDFRTERAMAI